MKNVFTYSLIGISISLISCSKNNSTKKNTNETAEFTPVEDNTPPRTPADGNKDKPINEDNFTQVQSERKLNGIYVSIEETNQEKFHLYKYSETRVYSCQGYYNKDNKIRIGSYSIMWKNNDEFTIFSGDIFGTTFHVYKEEIKNNTKIITTEIEKGFNTKIFTQTDNLKIINNHEEIIKDCKF